MSPWSANNGTPKFSTALEFAFRRIAIKEFCSGYPSKRLDLRQPIPIYRQNPAADWLTAL